MRKLFIVVAVVVALLSIILGGIAWSLRPTILDTSDSSQYPDLLGRFDPLVCKHLPASIPAGAKDFRMKYRGGGGGLGPGFMVLDARFVVDPQSISAMTDHARAAKGVNEESLVGSVIEWRVRQNGGTGVLKLDGTTGEVTIHAGLGD